MLDGYIDVYLPDLKYYYNIFTTIRETFNKDYLNTNIYEYYKNRHSYTKVNNTHMIYDYYSKEESKLIFIGKPAFSFFNWTNIISKYIKNEKELNIPLEKLVSLNIVQGNIKIRYKKQILCITPIHKCRAYSSFMSCSTPSVKYKRFTGCPLTTSFLGVI